MNVLAALVLAGLAWGQKEPEFPDVFFAQTQEALVPLERQAATQNVKAGGFVVGNGKASVVVQGSHSPMRLTGQRLSFIVKPQSVAIDPSEVYHLRRLTSRKSTREVILSTIHARPLGATSKTMNDSLVEFSATRFGEASLKFSIDALEPGEYAFAKAGGRTLFCFGVDGETPNGYRLAPLEK